MNAHTSPTRRPLLKALRSRKLRAILAGGLVLGLGATVTLAAWNDSEYAKATFTAGKFNLEASSDGGEIYVSTTAGQPAILPFRTAPPTLSPGDVIYSPFALRLARGTTNSATVTMSAAEPNPAVAGLTYSVTQAVTSTCDQATVGKMIVPLGTPVGTVPQQAVLDLAKGDSTTPGAPAYLCFAVKAGTDLVQDQRSAASWRFAAESQR